MRPYPLIAALAVLSLGACASVRPANVALPGQFTASPAVVDAAVDLDRWWAAYNDPQLDRLVEAALVASPDSRAAAARLTEARATSSTALIAFLPQGAISGSTRETHTTQISGRAINIPGFSSTGESNSSSGAFNVSWEVDLFGRIFAVAKAARGDSDTARFAYEGARSSLAANIADSYFQIQGLAIQLADARRTAAIQTELMRIATLRWQRGLTALSDADRVAGDLAQANAQVEGLVAEDQAARRTLLVLVGRGIEPIQALAVPEVLSGVPPIPATTPGDLLKRRPDVRQAEAQIRSAVGRQTYANLAFFPTFTLTPGLGLSDSSQTGFASSTRNWSIGAGLTQPVLNVPRLLQDLKASSARTEQAVIAYERVVQTAYGEADNAMVRLAADQRRVVLLQDGEIRAHRAFDASTIRYQAGLDDLQATLGAEQSWRAVRSQLAAAQVQALRRSVQTYKTLGGGWPSQSSKRARPS